MYYIEQIACYIFLYNYKLTPLLSIIVENIVSSIISEIIKIKVNNFWKNAKNKLLYVYYIYNSRKIEKNLIIYL